MVAAGFSVWRLGAGECALFLGHVGVQVAVGGRGLGVPEPEGDDGLVDADVQESHGGGVPEGMGGDVLGPDGWAARGGGGGGGGDAMLDGVTAERPAGDGGEERVGGVAVALGEPGGEHGADRSQWRGSLPAALAGAADVRARAEDDVGAGEADELGDPQPGMGGED